jgi:hypothetical protein
MAANREYLTDANTEAFEESPNFLLFPNSFPDARTFLFMGSCYERLPSNSLFAVDMVWRRSSIERLIPGYDTMDEGDREARRHRVSGMFRDHVRNEIDRIISFTNYNFTRRFHNDVPRANQRPLLFQMQVINVDFNHDESKVLGYNTTDSINDMCTMASNWMLTNRMRQGERNMMYYVSGADEHILTDTELDWNFLVIRINSFVLSFHPPRFVTFYYQYRTSITTYILRVDFTTALRTWRSSVLVLNNNATTIKRVERRNVLAFGRGGGVYTNDDVASIAYQDELMHMSLEEETISDDLLQFLNVSSMSSVTTLTSELNPTLTSTQQTASATATVAPDQDAPPPIVELDDEDYAFLDTLISDMQNSIEEHKAIVSTQSSTSTSTANNNNALENLQHILDCVSSSDFDISASSSIITSANSTRVLADNSSVTNLNRTRRFIKAQQKRMHELFEPSISSKNKKLCETDILAERVAIARNDQAIFRLGLQPWADQQRSQRLKSLNLVRNIWFIKPNMDVSTYASNHNAIIILRNMLKIASQCDTNARKLVNRFKSLCSYFGPSDQVRARNVKFMAVIKQFLNEAKITPTCEQLQKLLVLAQFLKQKERVIKWEYIPEMTEKRYGQGKRVVTPCDIPLEHDYPVEDYPSVIDASCIEGLTNKEVADAVGSDSSSSSSRSGSGTEEVEEEREPKSKKRKVNAASGVVKGRTKAAASAPSQPTLLPGVIRRAGSSRKRKQLLTTVPDVPDEQICTKKSKRNVGQTNTNEDISSSSSSSDDDDDDDSSEDISSDSNSTGPSSDGASTTDSSSADSSSSSVIDTDDGDSYSDDSEFASELESNDDDDGTAKTKKKKKCKKTLQAEATDVEQV